MTDIEEAPKYFQAKCSLSDMRRELPKRLEAAGFEPSFDLHHFAEARMEPVADTGLSRLFVGTM